ncbi:MAG: transposase [Turicibacter sp.]|nr:transposase [Turicibacter sp.]
MIRAHKIRLKPNNNQATYFAKACGIARFAYNWGLAEWKRRYEMGEQVNERILRKSLNSIKREQFPWMYEVTKCAPQLAIKNNLNSAFRNFYRGLKQGEQVGFPKFHKKGIKDSFSLSNDQFQLKEKSVQIPNLGWVRLAEELRFEGKIMGATVSRTADKWFIAIQVEMPNEPIPKRESQAVGVDLGVKVLATLSEGTSITGSKASRKYEKQLRHINQSFSRKTGAKKGEKKSSNFVKTKRKLSRLYAKMANLRNDGTHKLTTMLVQNYTLIGIEDLNVKGMMSNHKLARSVADMSFFEFRRQLEYKALTAGTQIIVADRWFPSSKTCSACGIVKTKDELTLSMRTYECSCGFVCDRDVNAAINLRNYALKHA